MSYSEKTALWFHKPTALNQPLFQMPILGYVSGYQALLLFGVGMPVFFVTLNAYDIITALPPLGAITALAMIRPPILGYEGRFFVLVWFCLSQRRPKMSSKALRIPVSGAISIPKKAAPKKRPKPKPIRVRPAGRPIEISARLRTDHNQPLVKQVRILLDGVSIRTAVPSESGTLSVVLHPEECVGVRTVSVHEVGPEDTLGRLLVSKEVHFEA